MPQMDGATATKAIRAKGGTYAQQPIWAMTANVGKNDVQHCLDAGMNDFVEKPFKKVSLLAKIRQLMDDCSFSGEDCENHDASKSLNIEMKVIEQLFEDTGREVFGDILDLFINEAKNRIAAITDAFENGQSDVIRHEAHAIKSSAATVGAKELSELALHIESDIGPDKLVAVKPTIDLMVKTAEMTFKQLSALKVNYAE